MQVTPTTAVTAGLATAGAAAVRVVAGELAAIPVGALIQATVVRATPGEAVLDVGGKAVTVKPGIGLQAGGVVVVRSPAGGATPTLELVSKTPPQSKATPIASPLEAVLADVVAVLPDGKLHVRIDGRDEVATPAGEFTPGGRYVVQVERTPAGVVVRPLPDGPELPEAVASAVLRSGPPRELAAALKPLLAEVAPAAGPLVGRVESSRPDAPTGAASPVKPEAVLVGAASRAGPPSQRTDVPGHEATSLLARPVRLGSADLPGVTPSGPASTTGPLPQRADVPGHEATLPVARPVPLGTRDLPTSPLEGVPVRAATAEVREALRAIIPDDGRPPTAEKLRALVEDGGQQYEAKLARAADGGPPPAHDLKGGLLKLLQAAHDLGAATAFPAARAALEQIEGQQAANVLSQANNGPIFLQVPFPDGADWRTLHLSVESDRDAQQESGYAGRFQMLLHVPLSDLGETWVEAGLLGDNFRAVLYLDGAAARDRVTAELPELRAELLADGFADVSLDVRPSAQLPERHRRRGAAMRAGRPEGEPILDVEA